MKFLHVFVFCTLSATLSSRPFIESHLEADGVVDANKKKVGSGGEGDSQVVHNHSWGFVKSIANTVKSAVSNTVSAVKSVATKVSQGAVAIGKGVVKTAGSIKTVVAKASSGDFKGAIQAGVQAGKDAMATVKTVKTTVTNVTAGVHNAINVAKNSYAQAKGAVVGGIQQGKAELTNQYNNYVQQGKNMYNGFKDNIVQQGQQIYQQGVNAVQGVVSPFQSAGVQPAPQPQPQILPAPVQVGTAAPLAVSPQPAAFPAPYLGAPVQQTAPVARPVASVWPGVIGLTSKAAAPPASGAGAVGGDHAVGKAIFVAAEAARDAAHAAQAVAEAAEAHGR